MKLHHALCALFAIILCVCVVDAEDSLADRANALFAGWVEKSAIPGKYSTVEERLAQTTHPGDLTSGPHLYFHGAEGVHAFDHGMLSHTQPNPAFEHNATARGNMLDAVAWMLRRGMSRLQDDVGRFLSPTGGVQDQGEVDHLLTLAREALNSFEDFWRQCKWTVEFGPRQVQADKPEHLEYGPETNWWLKFRPTLACHHTPRLGAELGGAKSWCNPHHWPTLEGTGGPKFVLSAGSGGDFHYEHFVADQWPGVTVITTDCFSLNEATTRQMGGGKRGKVVALPVCLGGEDPQYHDFVKPESARAKFVQYPEMMRTLQQDHGIDHFDLIKANIEVYEYPLFAQIMRQPDANLRGTAQIHMEMHRMGMQDRGLNYDSLLYMELLWATMLSGGFHAVSMEKWHDSTAASDFVWVNQSWWMEGELEARRGIWKRSYPEPQVTEAILPSPVGLRDAYIAAEVGQQRPPHSEL